MARFGRGLTKNGYTLVEMLIATTLTLVMMAGVATVFGMVGSGISASRASLEMAEALRAVAQRIRNDLAGTTVPMNPPRHPDASEGYFEYKEGPIGPVVASTAIVSNTDVSPTPLDSTVGDTDDTLALTTRSAAEPLVGRALIKRAASGGEIPTGNDGNDFVAMYTAESQEAEVVYFVRGNTLYRRMLLVRPQHDADLRSGAIEMQLDSRRKPPTYSGATDPPYPVVNPAGLGFFNDYDISVRMTEFGTNGVLVANSLADLTKPQNRFAHQHVNIDSAGNRNVSYPFHPHFFVNWQAIQTAINNGAEGTIAYDSGAGGAWNAERSVWASLGFPIHCETSYMHPQNPAIALSMANSMNSWIAGGGEMGAAAQWPGHLPVTATEWPGFTPAYTPTFPEVDAWLSPYAVGECDPMTGAITLAPIPGAPGESATRYSGSRVGDDVILRNVIDFDVKAWDPNAPVIARRDTQGTPSLVDDTVTVIMPGDPTYIRAMYLRDNTDPLAPNVRYDVVSFGAYVDLNYLCRLGPWDWNGTEEFANPAYPSILAMYADTGRPTPVFGYAGDFRSGVRGTRPSPMYRPATDASLVTQLPYRGALRSAVYDTWSDHYEIGGQGKDGLDNNGDGIVDDAGELLYPPPFTAPLRGIQIKIRVFEPDSRQIREVTIVHDFTSK